MITKSIPINKIEIVENIRTSTTDPRMKSLMQSIKQHGLKEPIGVARTKEGDYVLEYGFRRLTAFKKLGYKTIPAVINPESDIANLLIVNTIENIQRKDITPAELGRICVSLRDLELTEGEIAARLDVPVLKVKYAINIYMMLPKEIRDKVSFFGPGKSAKHGKISATVAYTIIRIRATFKLSKDVLMKLAEEARKNELTTREVELVGLLLKSGMSAERAVKERSNYRIVRTDTIVMKEEAETRKKKHKVGLSELIKLAAYGRIKPFTEPAVRRGGR